jgi:ATP-binding cassette, subfamily B (MDR/TAP), member 1
MTLAIGNAFNSFSQYPVSGATSEDSHRLLHDVRWIALELLGLGFGIMILSSVTSGLWIQAGERNVLAIRKHVYSAVTRKDLVWFDTETGKDSQADMGVGGLMAAFTKYNRLIS